jgi:hypothetical protein
MIQWYSSICWIPLAQAGEFHLDCMVRYAHQFSFIPHTYDLTMFLMAHKGGLDKILHRSLWYDVLPSSEDEFKSCRSPTLFPPDGCIQKQESKTWLIWIPMVISVAQRRVSRYWGWWTSNLAVGSKNSSDW